MKHTEFYCDICKKKVTDKGSFPCRHVIINISHSTNMITSMFSKNAVKVSTDDVCKDCVDKLSDAIGKTLKEIVEAKS